MERNVVKTITEVKEVLKDFDFKLFSCDTETSSLKYYDQRIEGISLYDGKKVLYIDLLENPDTPIILDYIRSIVQYGQGSIVAMHNAPFDLKVLNKFGIFLDDAELFDTMVASHLLDENRQSHALKILTKELLGHDVVMYDEASLNKKSQKYYDYAMNDAVFTYELMLHFKPQLESQGLVKLFREIEMPFLKVLAKMEMNGVLIDKDKVEVTTKELIEAQTNLEIEMLQYLKEPYSMQCNLVDNSLTVQSNINFNSSQDLKRIIEKLGIENTAKTDTGAPSYGKEFILQYKKEKDGKVEYTHEFVGMLDRYKIIQKLLTAFFEPLPGFIDGDGRVRPNFIDIGAATGRLSCRNPNLQQLPKKNLAFPVDTRSCFIVPKGYKMISADYSGQEIRVLAEVTQDPTLVTALRNGADLHLSTANTFFNLGIPEEHLSEGSAEYEKYKKKYKNERSKAKTITFGLSYGKSGFGFAKDFGITEDEGNKILERYFAQFPQVKSAMDKCKDEIDKNDNVAQLFGRRRRFTKVGGDGKFWHVKKSYRQGFNFLIQSPSADMIRLASIATYKLAKKYPEWDLKMIMSIHDECDYQVKEEYADIAAQEIKKCFENVVQFCVPMLCEVQIGNNYGDSK